MGLMAHATIPQRSNLLSLVSGDFAPDALWFLLGLLESRLACMRDFFLTDPLGRTIVPECTAARLNHARRGSK